MRYAIIQVHVHVQVLGQASWLELNGKTKTIFFFEKHSMKFSWESPSRVCSTYFGEDGMPLVVLEHFFRVENRPGQAWSVFYDRELTGRGHLPARERAEPNCHVLLTSQPPACNLHCTKR